MSIKRIEAQLVRLNAKIETREAELSTLKGQRKELKAQLADLKKAAKDGKLRPTPPPEGLAERFGAAFSENIIEPISDMLSPAPAKASQ